MSNQDNNKGNKMGTGIALGVIFGVLLGWLVNILYAPLGLGGGVFIGTIFDNWRKDRKK